MFRRALIYSLLLSAILASAGFAAVAPVPPLKSPILPAVRTLFVHGPLPGGIGMHRFPDRFESYPTGDRALFVSAAIDHQLQAYHAVVDKG